MSSPPTQAPPPAQHQDAAAPLAVDDDATAPFDNDNDSTYSAAPSGGLTSLRSSVLAFKQENGRTYHSMSEGKYNYPNDDAENERLDLQHNLWLLTLRGELGLSPKAQGSPKRVLDAGTGTGIWAIEFADCHPESEVIGVDLSPIQPSLVPPNCSFEADDLEKDWTWSTPFDLIFARVMCGCFKNMQDFVNKAYDNLEPGGYLEMHDFMLPYTSDDGTLREDMELRKQGLFVMEASAKAGRPIDITDKYKANMEAAGFVDVVERRFKWPLNPWPKDPHHKELGLWCLENFDGGLEGLLMALYTRFLGWKPEEVTLFVTQVRKQLRDKRIHAYLPIYVVYGRKPDNAPVSTAQD